MSLVRPDGGFHPTREVLSGPASTPRRLGANLAVIDKRRTGVNTAEVMRIVGDVGGRDVVIIDDMVDTAGTLVQATDALRKQGARRLFAAATPRRPVGSAAVKRLRESHFEGIVVTNTVWISPEKRIPKIQTLSVARVCWARRSGRSTRRPR